MSLLKVQNLSIEFGGLKAVTDVSLTLEPGMLAGLIGPNGAGKTTVFNMLTGVYQPTAGSIAFESRSLLGLKPYQICAHGIARTFQNIRLFGNLSVLDNVKIASHLHAESGVAASFFATAGLAREEREVTERAMRLLEIFKLQDKAHEMARNLPYGEQRRLEIARALATRPRLLLLDEPAAGMNPQETSELTDLIRFIRDTFKLTILLIEHDMDCVMSVCEKIFVLEYGVLIAAGTADAIRHDPRVIAAYLGTEA
jgi:branched-chain amino acid transport system ATP-binding protein